MRERSACMLLMSLGHQQVRSHALPPPRARQTPPPPPCAPSSTTLWPTSLGAPPPARAPRRAGAAAGRGSRALLRAVLERPGCPALRRAPPPAGPGLGRAPPSLGHPPLRLPAVPAARAGAAAGQAVSPPAAAAGWPPVHAQAGLPCAAAPRSARTSRGAAGHTAVLSCCACARRWRRPNHAATSARARLQRSPGWGSRAPRPGSCRARSEQGGWSACRRLWTGNRSMFPAAWHPAVHSAAAAFHIVPTAPARTAACTCYDQMCKD